jgi:hypothetical protein
MSDIGTSSPPTKRHHHPALIPTEINVGHGYSHRDIGGLLAKLDFDQPDSEDEQDDSELVLRHEYERPTTDKVGMLCRDWQRTKTKGEAKGETTYGGFGMYRGSVATRGRDVETWDYEYAINGDDGRGLIKSKSNNMVRLLRMKPPAQSTSAGGTVTTKVSNRLPTPECEAIPIYFTRVDCATRAPREKNRDITPRNTTLHNAGISREEYFRNLTHRGPESGVYMGLDNQETRWTSYSLGLERLALITKGRPSDPTSESMVPYLDSEFVNDTTGYVNIGLGSQI